MKKITIYTSNTDPIVIEDLDEKDIASYSNELSAILESNNISILYTHMGSLIIRPNLITGINIEDLKNPEIIKNKKIKKVKTPKTSSEQNKLNEDIITG